MFSTVGNNTFGRRSNLKWIQEFITKKLYKIDSKIIADQVRAFRSSNAQANSLLPGAIPQKKKKKVRAIHWVHKCCR